MVNKTDLTNKRVFNHSLMVVLKEKDTLLVHPQILLLPPPKNIENKPLTSGIRNQHYSTAKLFIACTTTVANYKC